MRTMLVTVLVGMLVGCAAQAACNTPPEGFVALFDGKDLKGWKGLVGNPVSRSKMKPEELAIAQRKADAAMRQHWRVANGQIINDGKGPHLCTTKSYGDFELWVDWKISAGGDSGIYLRGSPQVQIWDPWEGQSVAKVGSGGLYNNQKHPSNPLVKADNPPGQWNTFYIRMIGERVTVKLNGKLVVDDVVMENYWNHGRPIFPSEQIELQSHSGETRFRNIYIREIPPEEANVLLQKQYGQGFCEAFNGKDLGGWIGAVNDYEVRNGAIVCKPGKGGMVVLKDQYSDFALRFEFRLPKGGNNGVAVRAPLKGEAAYAGMEIQVLDDTAEKYARLRPAQYHGSIYDVAPAHRGYVRPVGQWNYEEIVAKGSQIKVSVNGTTILDIDLANVPRNAHRAKHPGLDRKKGYIGFAGHKDPVDFRNVRIRDDSNK